MDSSYAVREIDMGMNRNINIDWINDLSIKQDFEKSGQESVDAVDGRNLN